MEKCRKSRVNLRNRKWKMENKVVEIWENLKKVIN